MRIFHYTDVKAVDAEEGASKLKVRWLITKETGAEHFVMRLFEMEPRGYSPFHTHPWEHEVFILEGEGRVIGKEQEKNLRAGDVIFISANEKHQFINVGKQTLKFICLIPS